jgi:hypothetical protein
LTKDPKGEQQILDQIQQSWSQAQRQLEQLKRAVAENAEVGAAKAHLDDAESERERKLVALGEAVVEHFGKAGVQVPAALKAALDAARAAEARLQAERSSIRDLLQEAEVVKKEPPKKKSGK